MGIAFIFAGQGAQAIGMARDLSEKYASAGTAFDIGSEILGRDLRNLSFLGSKEDLDITTNTQPCVLAADLCAHAAATERGIKADAVAGFSLGEYAALTAAGVFSIETAFRIISVRAEAMQAACPPGAGAMAAVMTRDAAVVPQICSQVTSGYVAPSNFNCPGQIVVAGDKAAVDEFAQIASGSGVRVTVIPVSVPSHCELMRPACDDVRKVLESAELRSADIPCYMNVDAAPAGDPGDIIGRLADQIVKPVLWEQTILNMAQAGIDTFIELGPGKTLSGFVKKIVPSAAIYRISDCETLDDCCQKIMKEN